MAHFQIGLNEMAKAQLQSQHGSGMMQYSDETKNKHVMTLCRIGGP